MWRTLVPSGGRFRLGPFIKFEDFKTHFSPPITAIMSPVDDDVDVRESLAAKPACAALSAASTVVTGS